jgi:hypothetical protein
MVFLLVLASFSLARNSELTQIRQDLGQFREKISPVLLDEVAYRKARPAVAREIPVIVKVSEDYFQQDLENRLMRGTSQRNMLEQGNGLLNSLKATRLAGNLDVETFTLQKRVSPSWTMEDEEVWAGGAYAFEDRIVYSQWVDPQAIFHCGEGVFWSDHFKDLGETLNGFFWTDSFFGLEGVFWSDSCFNLEGVFWSDDLLWSFSQSGHD